MAPNSEYIGDEYQPPLPPPTPQPPPPNPPPPTPHPPTPTQQILGPASSSVDLHPQINYLMPHPA